MSAELLRKAADLIEQRAAPDRALSRPLDAVFDQWSLGPQVAAPLAAWLRESATELELRQVRVAGLNIPEQDA